MLSLLLLACTPEPVEEFCEWPATAAAPEGVVEASCGWYTLAVGEHLYADVFTTEPEVPCDAALDDGLVLNATPIYTALNGTPKYTFDVVAEAAGEGLLVDITCDEGTRWQARLDVE